MSTDASDAGALQIAQFIVNDLEYSGPVTDLLGSEPVRLPEALDSAALLELASFIEDEFGVEIQDEDIVPQNFATVAAVVRLLHDKGAFSPPGRNGDRD